MNSDMEDISSKGATQVDRIFVAYLTYQLCGHGTPERRLGAGGRSLVAPTVRVVGQHDVWMAPDRGFSAKICLLWWRIFLICPVELVAVAWICAI
jgi:hypothetical protein